MIVHCGSGPLPGAHTGPGPFAAVLARHPRLTAVIAHCGAPEYGEFIALARRVPERPSRHHDGRHAVHERDGRRAGPDTIAALGDLQDRVVLGTDFPNIPYAYAEQLAALERFGLGDDWLRAVCWHNGARLLGYRG